MSLPRHHIIYTKNKYENETKTYFLFMLISPLFPFSFPLSSLPSFLFSFLFFPLFYSLSPPLPPLSLPYKFTYTSVSFPGGLGGDRRDGKDGMDGKDRMGDGVFFVFYGMKGRNGSTYGLKRNFFSKHIGINLLDSYMSLVCRCSILRPGIKNTNLPPTPSPPPYPDLC